MRSLLIVTAFALSFTATACCVEKATAEVKADYIRPYVVPPQTVQSDGRFSWIPRTIIKRHWSPTDTTCYTMRSMLVEKEPGSDVTQVVGQRTCTPSSHFQMKHSVQQPK